MRDKRGMSPLLALGVAVLLIASSVSVYFLFFDDEDSDITVAWANKDCYEPFWIAEKMGFWEDEGVKVNGVILHNGSDIASALMRGDADLGGMGADPLLRMLRDSDKASILTRYQAGENYSEFVTYNGANDGKITDQKINDALNAGTDDEGNVLSDWSFLKGSRVGMQTGTAYWSWFLGFLEDVGLSVDDFKIVPLNFNIQVAALNNREVDIISGGSPNTETALKTPGNIMFKDTKADMTTICLMATGDAQENKGDAITKVLKGLQRACDYIYENPLGAAKIIVEVYGERNWTVNNQMDAFNKNIWGLDMLDDDFNALNAAARLINAAGQEQKGTLPTDVESRYNSKFMIDAGLPLPDFIKIEIDVGLSVQGPDQSSSSSDDSFSFSGCSSSSTGSACFSE